MSDKQRAHALQWSAGQAELVAAADAGQLRYGQDGVLREHPQPGQAGRTVADGRLVPLLRAGFLTRDGERVAVTADGRAAVRLWRRWRPAPVERDRSEERQTPLRPLLGGEEAARRATAAAEDERRRAAERDDLYSALERLHAWEARDDRLWEVWARVQGITYRLGRRRPRGWVPTAEEIAKHFIAQELVDELRADAESPQERPEVPHTPALRSRELPPLPAAPDAAEQLDLFAP
ncbi:hypothetical protein [Streptomyces boncukensis]|uniref:Uncharacterized protein n=1 Tax=Streptomyces boncukensis TaxID=2711219 RepID=A0A6G4WTA3_9ACTN|nr:hypothetical protein [Streptomyces boncukensis]NGO67870.1 hypothetical protein [Streptomyces boncukensis]